MGAATNVSECLGSHGKFHTNLDALTSKPSAGWLQNACKQPRARDVGQTSRKHINPLHISQPFFANAPFSPARGRTPAKTRS